MIVQTVATSLEGSVECERYAGGCKRFKRCLVWPVASAAPIHDLKWLETIYY